jgi:hypothetical protein
MTNPTATKKATPKATVTPEVKETVVESTPEVVETEVVKDRTPESLASDSILASFCERYLLALDEIAAYNKEVLQKSDSDWTSAKVLEKARELARPTSKDVKANETILRALKAFEDAADTLTKTRREVLEITAKDQNIVLSNTSERDSEREAPLREKRTFAVAIGNQLESIAKMTTNEKATEDVLTFLKDNPLPAIGRDQSRTFGVEEKATPKYRVIVIVKNNDGEKLVEEAGFTKAANSLTKHYPRGKSLKTDDLRKAWESAGNTPEKTVVSPVVFEDNDLSFEIHKKN